MKPEFIDTEFEDEESGVIWIGMHDLKSTGLEVLGGKDDKKHHKRLNRMMSELGTTDVAHFTIEYSSSNLRSVQILEAVIGYLAKKYKVREYTH